VLDVAARHGSGGDLRPADGVRGDVRAADAIVGDGARAHGPGSDLDRRYRGRLEGCGDDAVVLGCRLRDGLDVAVEREQADREAGDGDDHLPTALDGYRGAPKADAAALEDLLVRISALVEAHPQIAELECNPVVVTPAAATVVDVRVRVHRPTAAPPAPSVSG